VRIGRFGFVEQFVACGSSNNTRAFFVVRTLSARAADQLLVIERNASKRSELLPGVKTSGGAAMRLTSAPNNR
jgi:hypothetical protein